MGKVILQCPSCGGQVELGDIECRHCGMNLKSGESYEEQVKKARGKDQHPERPVAPLVLGAAMLFGLLLLSGWAFQRRMEKAVTTYPGMFTRYIQEFQNIEDLVQAGDYSVARERTEKLINALEKQAESIDVPDPYVKEKEDPWRKTTAARKKKKGYEAATRQLLLTLKAKAERRLKEIPAS